MKVTVVGAGAVGASCAEYIAMKNFASEVVLLDIKEGYAEAPSGLEQHRVICYGADKQPGGEGDDRDVDNVMLKNQEF